MEEKLMKTVPKEDQMLPMEEEIKPFIIHMLKELKETISKKWMEKKEDVPNRK